MPQHAPDTSAWLVATKLCPPRLRGDLIRRPHLESALRRSVTSLPLTLLSAPAGYGKTTMLATLPCLVPEMRLAWATLDAEDNDPVRFIGLVTAALGRLHPRCGRTVWPLLAGALGEADLKRAVGALINEVLELLPEPFILVLDDLHTVTEPAAFAALEYLLDHQPPQLHLAVGTRHDPPLRLARLAARRQLAELRRSDLLFSPEESDLLLNGALGLGLTPAEVAALQERTEGWPAGLCLLAAPLGRLAAPDRSRFLVHVERTALDFLADEVFRNLPDPVRRFLLETSVLPEMTPSNCRAITGRADAAEMLEALYRQNLTIAAIATGQEGEPVYRHHALFARLLSRQLEREMPGEIPRLHRRAAELATTPGRAIGHYVAAGLWDEAAQVTSRSGMALLHQGMAETVRTWVYALPEEARARRPELMVILARTEIHRGDYAAAAALLTQAREACVAGGDAAGEGEALTSLITLSYQNDDRRMAREYVAAARRLPLSPMGEVAARLCSAWLHLSAGEWDACGREVREALAIPGATGDRRADIIGITYMSAPLAAVPGCLELTERYCAEAGALAPAGTAWRLGADELGAWPLLLRGRLDEALARAKAADEARQRLSGYPFVGVDAAAVLAILHTARGEAAEAEQAAGRLRQRLEAAARGKWPFYLHAAGRSLALLGRHDEARALLERLWALPGDDLMSRYLREHLSGLIALLEEKRSEAEGSLRRAAEWEAELPVSRTSGSARLLLARLRLEQRRQEEARTLAEPVLSAWKRDGTPGCALLDGPAIGPVRHAVGRASRGAGARPCAAGDAVRLPEPLTQREEEVLRLIVAGRTNRQIGAALFISEETVKSHVAHILRKLDVATRTQAAVRGREMGY